VVRLNPKIKGSPTQMLRSRGKSDRPNSLQKERILQTCLELSTERGRQAPNDKRKKKKEKKKLAVIPQRKKAVVLMNKSEPSEGGGGGKKKRSRVGTPQDRKKISSFGGDKNFLFQHLGVQLMFVGGGRKRTIDLRRNTRQRGKSSPRKKRCLECGPSMGGIGSTAGNQRKSRVNDMDESLLRRKTSVRFHDPGRSDSSYLSTSKIKTSTATRVNRMNRGGEKETERGSLTRSVKKEKESLRAGKGEIP